MFKYSAYCVLIISAYICIGNFLEYHLLKKDNIRYITGRVKTIDRKLYDCGGRRIIRNCERTVFKIEGVGGSFIVASYASDDDGYLTGIDKGDTVKVGIRYWYQYLLTFGRMREVYNLEKIGTDYKYSYLKTAKSDSLGLIILAGLIAVIFAIIIIADKVVRLKLARGEDV